LFLQLSSNYWINKEINESLRARINDGALLSWLHVKAPPAECASCVTYCDKIKIEIKNCCRAYIDLLSCRLSSLYAFLFFLPTDVDPSSVRSILTGCVTVALIYTCCPPVVLLVLCLCSSCPLSVLCPPPCPPSVFYFEYIYRKRAFYRYSANIFLLTTLQPTTNFWISREINEN